MSADIIIHKRFIPLLVYRAADNLIHIKMANTLKPLRGKKQMPSIEVKDISVLDSLLKTDGEKLISPIHRNNTFAIFLRQHKDILPREINVMHGWIISQYEHMTAFIRICGAAIIKIEFLEDNFTCKKILFISTEMRDYLTCVRNCKNIHIMTDYYTKLIEVLGNGDHLLNFCHDSATELIR
jgi:hypothetical protein